MVGLLKRLLGFKKKITSEKTSSGDVSVVYNGNDTECQSPLYTFYSVGPSYFTFSYPVDTDCIEKEILSKDGLIGSVYYAHIPAAIESLNDYDNEWFLEEKNKETREHLLSDL